MVGGRKQHPGADLLAKSSETKRKKRNGDITTSRMRDVAHKAGVSVMTVSRALNDPEKVSKEMRRRVRAVVDEIGYVPNRLAQSLSSNRSNVIGLIVPSIRNSLFAETIKGISDVLSVNGHHLMIADSGPGLHEEEEAITAFVQQRVAGLVLHNTSHTAAAIEMIGKAKIPLVENGNLTTTPLDSVVSYSNYEASRAMTLHLARMGHKQIAFVSLVRRENDRARERLRGYLAALGELGRKQNDSLILERPSGFSAGSEAVVHLVENTPQVDAIFFAGDVLAVGAALECQRRGWAVPGRIALASFDDLDMLRHINPPLTTLRLPRYEIGKRSAECLLDRISGRVSDRVTLDLKFEIIQRESA
jgi:LacI family transcriptional regulator, gluconate utilization system Gnt-I transcriptional repressor